MILSSKHYHWHHYTDCPGSQVVDQTQRLYDDGNCGGIALMRGRIYAANLINAEWDAEANAGAPRPNVKGTDNALSARYHRRMLRTILIALALFQVAYAPYVFAASYAVSLPVICDLCDADHKVFAVKEVVLVAPSGRHKVRVSPFLQGRRLLWHELRTGSRCGRRPSMHRWKGWLMLRKPWYRWNDTNLLLYTERYTWSFSASCR